MAERKTKTDCPSCSKSNGQKCEKCGALYKPPNRERSEIDQLCGMCGYWVHNSQIKANGGICNRCEDRRV